MPVLVETNATIKSDRRLTTTGEEGRDEVGIEAVVATAVAAAEISIGG